MKTELEELIARIGTDASLRPRFYEALLQSELLVVSVGEVPPSIGKSGVASENASLQLWSVEHDGAPHIPAFTSTARMADAGLVGRPYLAIPTLDLLRMIDGAGMLLNPYGRDGEVLILGPRMVRAIADGSVSKPDAVTSVPKGSPIRVCEPACLPTELLDALTALFRRDSAVKSAYIASIQLESESTEHTLVAIECEGDWNALMKGVGAIARSARIPNPPLDFIRLWGGGLDSYFRAATPFYRKKLFGIF